MTTYRIFCDESCHLENDKNSIMLLGAVWCPSDQVKDFSNGIRSLKEDHHARGELKWTKVSNSRLDFYRSIVNYFFEQPLISFRSLIVTHKERLNHSYYNRGSHGSFYFKMYFYLLRNIIKPENAYEIFMDIKDTRSQESVNKLGEVLSNNFLDFERQYIQKIQHIRSGESELLQLTDFLLGAVSYKNRGLRGSEAKLAIVNDVTESSGLDLVSTTPPWEDKFNLFLFSPREPHTENE